jgi:hypothetical protein
MENATLLIQEYLERFRRGDGESAFFGLTEMDHDVLPELIAAFKKERDNRVRAFLVGIIWQHRQQSAIPFLAEVLHDPVPDVWKEALDGLVALASLPALDALRSARTRQFPRQRDSEEFRRWLEEAIEQAEAEYQRTQQ